jgi:hypothetical protein
MSDTRTVRYRGTLDRSVDNCTQRAHLRASTARYDVVGLAGLFLDIAHAVEAAVTFAPEEGIHVAPLRVEVDRFQVDDLGMAGTRCEAIKLPG